MFVKNSATACIHCWRSGHSATRIRKKTHKDMMIPTWILQKICLVSPLKKPRNYKKSWRSYWPESWNIALMDQRLPMTTELTDSSVAHCGRRLTKPRASCSRIRKTSTVATCPPIPGSYCTNWKMRYRATTLRSKRNRSRFFSRGCLFVDVGSHNRLEASRAAWSLNPRSRRYTINSFTSAF